MKEASAAGKTLVYMLDQRNYIIHWSDWELTVSADYVKFDKRTL